MTESLSAHYLADINVRFHNYKSMADRAMARVDDEAYFAVLDPEANSIAILVKHMAGNAHSRWRDFLTTDGEKPDRNRDSEFELYDEDTRQALQERWEAGWQLLFDAVDPLTPDDLMAAVTIRGQPHTVVQALNRQIAHCAYHVGQIVLLAKHAQSEEWKTLSIPRGQSEQFNQKVWRRT